MEGIIHIIPYLNILNIILINIIYLLIKLCNDYLIYYLNNILCVGIMYIELKCGDIRY